MQRPEIEEFAKILVRQVRDAAIQSNDVSLGLLEKANEACTDLGVKVRNRHYPGPQQSG